MNGKKYLFLVLLFFAQFCYAEDITRGVDTDSLATSDNQTNGDQKTKIVNSSGVVVDSFGTDPVGLKNTSAVAINPATSDAQTIGNNSLSSIDGKITTCNTGAVAGSVSVTNGALVGTAGTPSADVLSIQGITSMTPILVTPSLVAPTTVGDGSKTVTTAGSRVALASSTSCKKVNITAKVANTGIIWVGGSTVANGSGKPLVPLQDIEIEVDNLADIYIDSTVNGDGVTFTYVN